jgi:predicted protein tyrosine phosphatase
MARDRGRGVSGCREIVVLDRVAAVDFTAEGRWACISIADTLEEFPTIRRARRAALLQLAFADIEVARPGYLLFTDSHAHDILDFVTHNWRRVKTLMIHCNAGLGRSPAVAAAIARLMRGDDREFFEEPYTPNAFVYRTLLEVASGREDYQRG